MDAARWSTGEVRKRGRERMRIYWTNGDRRDTVRMSTGGVRKRKRKR